MKDNLLNFATTSKGMLLMQQSSAMQACIEYMCKRHNQRLQVSHLEKFGYGSIITQIAGTACGMLELEKQGEHNLPNLYRDTVLLLYTELAAYLESLL